MQRRSTLKVLATTLVAFAAVASTHAQADAQADAQKQLASDRFTIVSPFPPGGPVDTLARILSDGLAKRYGQAAVVENMAGAAGNIGIDKVKRAKADGHTLLVVPAGNLTINPTLMPNFPFNIEKDFAPVTMLAKAPNVLVASPTSGIKSAKELVAMAKAKPGTLSYASPGVGSGLHLAGELFKQQAAVDLLHVPYKGTAPAINDVLGGTVPLMFSNLPATLPFIKSGKLVALGITEAKRSPVAPEIPTLAEQGIQGVNVTSWYGLLAPAGTPPAVVEQLARDAAAMLAQPDVAERLKAQGMTEATMKPAEFAAAMREETAVWARIIKARNIVAE
ncbi:tripartite tricarboxylate transporter substrate binding protein [Variovorax sp. J22R133]|uniref:Bug family tripartite tricarboxylate transporter substrate binding protein n=1 Tax=Variovorax brevis TaxID=3053503 RepID=UPI00257847D0|nr:tripartite tricarboxylate transporter substrate binding protein [Variovorax sp. J22R133]MDM0115172.1 tripartite tricarboxylate transporter substrate binding protein [Variovorax sp. J22R133]